MEEPQGWGVEVEWAEAPPSVRGTVPKPQVNGAAAVHLFLPTFLLSFRLFSSLG